ncbi:MAG: hypothetical protein SFX74_09930 [Fimbriimonadaceae bacterium]|nr:hypothetical protein [Fimbriimonadaceae bacterium]
MKMRDSAAHLLYYVVHEFRLRCIDRAVLGSAIIVLSSYFRYPEKPPQSPFSKDPLKAFTLNDPAIGTKVRFSDLPNGQFLLIFPECMTGCTSATLAPELYQLRPRERAIVMTDHPDLRRKLEEKLPREFSYRKFDLRLAQSLNIGWAGRWVRIKDGILVQIQSTPQEAS